MCRACAGGSGPCVDMHGQADAHAQHVSAVHLLRGMPAVGGAGLLKPGPHSHTAALHDVAVVRQRHTQASGTRPSPKRCNVNMNGCAF